MTFGPEVLEGARVLLRPFRAEDIGAAYLGWLNDPELMRYSNQRFVTHTAESCTRYLAGFSCSPNRFLAITLRGDGRVVGTMTIYRAPMHGTADMGILLGDPQARGQGLALEAWTTALDWLLGPGGLRKVTAGTMHANRAMVGICERSGMELEAVRREQELLDGAPQDILLFARFHAG